ELHPPATVAGGRRRRGPRRTGGRTAGATPLTLVVSYRRPMDIDGFRKERDRIRDEMGGAAKVARLRAAGKRNAREHIDGLVDPGSFREVGTFARSERPEDRDATPADGKICGHATIDGRAVTLAVDDITVKRATSSLVGARKLQRVYEQAVRGGNPF